jgi:hypothetical protein
MTDAQPENARGAGSTSLVTRILAVSAVLVAVGGLLDAIVAVTTKAATLTCNLTVFFPWCSPSNIDGLRPKPLDPPDVEGLHPASAETPDARVNAFVITTYNRVEVPAGGMVSARREWKRVTPDRWIEFYPGGIPSYFEVIRRATLSDCPGTVLKNQTDKAHRVFIPDKGCAGMPFYISDDNKNWGIASAMTEVQ